jgi:hypothetical protein
MTTDPRALMAARIDPPEPAQLDLAPLEPNPELPGIIAELGGYCPTCGRFICNCITRREAQR